MKENEASFHGYWMILDDIGNACKVVASALGDPTSSTPQTNLHSNPCLALNSKDFSVEVLHLFRNQKHQAVCRRCGGGDAKSPPDHNPFAL